MIKKICLTLCLAAALLMIAAPVNAQDTVDAPVDVPVVYAILFYSPACGYCHEVINFRLPPIQAEFGEQLQIIFINVTDSQNDQIIASAYRFFNVPQDRRVVPMLFVGQRVLIGGDEIPNYLPGIVRGGLAAGGIALPPIPGIEIYAPTLNTTAYSSSLIGERLGADPVGNAVAIVVLVILTISVLTVVRYGWRGLRRGERLAFFNRRSWLRLPLITAIGAMLVVVTLLMEEATAETTLPVLLALGVMGVLAVVTFIILSRSRVESWLLPLVLLAGLGVALYLAVIELSEAEAACGALGNCNIVQHSPYARLFGTLPIGVLGVTGYGVMLTIWLVGKIGGEDYSHLANKLLLVLVLFGTIFSIYLTFLEPFVIGATCAWCLTSALLMLLALWLIVPAGWSALRGTTRIAASGV